MAIQNVSVFVWEVVEWLMAHKRVPMVTEARRKKVTLVRMVPNARVVEVVLRKKRFLVANGMVIESLVDSRTITLTVNVTESGEALFQASAEKFSGQPSNNLTTAYKNLAVEAGYSLTNSENGCCMFGIPRPSIQSIIKAFYNLDLRFFHEKVECPIDRRNYANLKRTGRKRSLSIDDHDDASSIESKRTCISIAEECLLDSVRPPTPICNTMDDFDLIMTLFPAGKVDYLPKTIHDSELCAVLECIEALGPWDGSNLFEEAHD